LASFVSRAARLIVVAFAAAQLSACGVNTIPTLDEQVKAQWGEVQNQYQRRADLIPNLVATVQGYAAQERTVLTEVTEARSRATSIQVTPETIRDPAALQQFQQAQDQLSGALSRLLVVSERYPELRSNQNFLALQSQLEGTENRIAIARRDYNEAVRQYNTEIRTFPGSIWASTVHGWAEPASPFAAQAGAERAPTVNFNTGAPAPAAAPAPAVTGAAPAQ
jgi:LemA protein